MRDKDRFFNKKRNSKRNTPSPSRSDSSATVQKDWCSGSAKKATDGDSDSMNQSEDFKKNSLFKAKQEINSSSQ